MVNEAKITARESGRERAVAMTNLCVLNLPLLCVSKKAGVKRNALKAALPRAVWDISARQSHDVKCAMRYLVRN